MNPQEQLDARTQEIVCHQIGDLVLTAARRKAENEALQAEIARLTALIPKPAPEPAPV